MKIWNNFNLLKTMLKSSYDTSAFIDEDTHKLNKKSSRVWALGIAGFIIIYISYMLVDFLRQYGVETFVLELYFTILQFIIMFQSAILTINMLYFADDMENYLHLPIKNTKLMITRFFSMISIVLGTIAIIVIPSLYIYGLETAVNLGFYLLVIIVTFLITIFLSAIVTIVTRFVMRIFRFIRSKYLYQNAIIIIMTVLIFLPMSGVFSSLAVETAVDSTQEIENEDIVGESDNNTGNIESEDTVANDIEEELENETEEDIEDISSMMSSLQQANKYFIVTELGVKALTEVNLDSIVYVLEIFGLDLLALIALAIMGKYTYIKDVLWNLSIFDKKKNKKINLKKRCKVKNKNRAYLHSEITTILKNPTFFMNYIYNVLIIITGIVLLTVTIYPIIIEVLIENGGEDIFEGLEFDFSVFSVILGLIELLFLLSKISLTAVSRYGKNAIFFKYIPIKYLTQFKLKNIPQLIVNTLIIIATLATIRYLVPAIDTFYIIMWFVVAMLMNIINCNILLLIDLARPQLNYENDITVIKQNDNKLFQYILVAGVCLVLWYLYEVTKEVSLNTAVIIETIVFAVIVAIIEFIIIRKRNKLFKKVY